MTRVLVIEDERYLLEDIVELLRYSYFDAQGAANGQEGIDLALRQPPDLILCDVMMPGIDGYQVLEQIRAHPATATIPFIFLTAKADRDSMRYGMDLGADDYLTKPFTSAELVTAVQTRLKRYTGLMEQSEQRLDYVKKQLARMVTHELRTPLISINTVVDVISRQVNQLTTRELRELMDTIDAGSKRLNHRVEQLVYITQLEAGLLDAETVRGQGMTMQMWELLVASTNLARRFAYQQQPNVSVQMHEHDREAMVVCNPPALKQALAELIANALTFAPENSNVEVTEWRSKGYVWISVSDRGAGIPQEKLKAALEAFQQLERETREQQGIGVGLTLAHQIIHAHGGTLDIRSVVGKGTQVTVSLPLARQPVPAV